MATNRARTASLVHLRVQKTYGGPHVGTDTTHQPIKSSVPVILQSGRATLVCELESCGLTYDVRLLTIKERCKMVATRALVVIAVIVAGTLMAQLGSWIGEITNDSDGLRIVGNILIGAGVVVNCLVMLWTLMSFWFWPDRYKLTYVTSPTSTQDELERTSAAIKSSPDVRQGHTVKLGRVR